jgi:hypothetical protein
MRTATGGSSPSLTTAASTACGAIVDSATVMAILVD